MLRREEDGRTREETEVCAVCQKPTPGSLEFPTFVLPPVPSAFLMHVVRQPDHLCVNFRQGFSPT